MRIRLLVISMALVICCKSHIVAQVEYKTTNYTHDLSPLKVSISFLNLENILTPITAGILIEGQLKDKIFYNAQFRQGYLRNVFISPASLITSQNESKGTVFEAGIDWPFIDRIKPGRVKVKTSSGFDGTYTYEKSFMAECEVRKFWAVSGGVLVYIRPKYINSDSSAYIITGGQDIKAGKDQFTHFNQTTFGLYGGFVHRKIKKAIVNSGEWNYRVFYSTKFYVHILIGNTKVGDIVYFDQTFQIDNARQMLIGYRLGWQWDQMGVVTGFEFGKMPGVKLVVPIEQSEITKIFSNNPFLNYVRFTFHFNIFNGDKNFHMKNRK